MRHDMFSHWRSFLMCDELSLCLVRKGCFSPILRDAQLCRSTRYPWQLSLAETQYPSPMLKDIKFTTNTLKFFKKLSIKSPFWNLAVTRESLMLALAKKVPPRVPHVRRIFRWKYRHGCPNFIFFKFSVALWTADSIAFQHKGSVANDFRVWVRVNGKMVQERPKNDKIKKKAWNSPKGGKRLNPIPSFLGDVGLISGFKMFVQALNVPFFGIRKCQKYPSLGAEKWHLRCTKENSKTTFISSTSPKNYGISKFCNFWPL